MIRGVKLPSEVSEMCMKPVHSFFACPSAHTRFTRSQIFEQKSD